MVNVQTRACVLEFRDRKAIAFHVRLEQMANGRFAGWAPGKMTG